MKRFTIIIIATLVLINIFLLYKNNKYKVENEDIKESINFMRKHLFCFEYLRFELDNNRGSAENNTTIIDIDDTITLYPKLIVDSYMTFDSVNAMPKVVLFKYMKNEFVAFDTIGYNKFGIETFKYVPKRIGEEVIFAGIFLEQYGYKISFPALSNFRTISNSNYIIDSTATESELFKLYDKFHNYIMQFNNINSKTVIDSNISNLNKKR